MIMTVFKYKLQPGKNKIELPPKSEILSVGEQNGGVFMWVLINPADPRNQTREFCIFGTGHDIDLPHRNFIGTVQTPSIMGQLVWHVFENLGA